VSRGLLGTEDLLQVVFMRPVRVTGLTSQVLEGARRRAVSARADRILVLAHVRKNPRSAAHFRGEASRSTSVAACDNSARRRPSGASAGNAEYSSMPDASSPVFGMATQ
jgi:hypothetical protein